MSEGETLREAIAIVTALRNQDIPAASKILRESDDLEDLAFTLGCVAARCVTDESIRSAALDWAEQGP